MKSSALISTLALLAASAAASLTTEPVPVQVTYDLAYDNSTNSLDSVACWNGPHGFELLGFTTTGSLPNFPFIGAAAVVAGFNSPNCGTCWQLTFQGQSINVLVIDHAAVGFNISFEALNVLTNGNAVALGTVNATAVQLTPADCGL